MQSDIINSFTDYKFLKLHFNNFDFIWTPDKNYLNITENSLQKRKDYYFFKKFTEKFTSRIERIEILISIFLKNKNAWIGEVFKNEYKEFHDERMKRKTSINYFFSKDCEKLDEYIDKNNILFIDLLKCRKHPYPEIINIGISLESLAIIDFFFSFTSQKTKDSKWEDIRLMIKKYKFFLGILKEKRRFQTYIDKLLRVDNMQTMLYNTGYNNKNNELA